MKNIVKKILPKALKKHLMKFLVRERNHGNTVICSICNFEFPSFAPHGDPRRKNAKCTNCGALERHRLFWKYLQDETDFAKTAKQRVLHFAPEKIFYKIFSANPSIEYIPCDLTPEKYRHEGGAPIRKVDITAIPFPDNYFEAILCSHVLEHVPDDRLAMREIHRVMKNGAWAILQVPIDYTREKTYEDFSITTPEGRKKAFGQWDHVRWYGRDYKDRLAMAGFIVNEDPYVKRFSKEDLYRFGFRAEELIYFCRKK